MADLHQHNAIARCAVLGYTAQGVGPLALAEMHDQPMPGCMTKGQQLTQL